MGAYSFPAASPFDDEDPKTALAGLLSPQPAHALVMPPPDTPPKTGPGQTTPQTGSLAYAPTQAVAKNRDSLASSFRTGVSNPPNGGYGATVSSDVQPASQGVQPVLRPGMPQPVNPDPGAFARPGGTTTPMPVLPQSGTQVNGPSQLDRDQSRLAYLTNSGSGIDQIKNPVGRTFARIGDIALGALAPGIAAAVPGTTLHHQQLLGQAQGIVGNDQAQQQAAAQTADTQQQTAQRAATAAKETAMAGADTPRAVTAQEAQLAGNPGLEGSIMRPSDIGKVAVQGVKNSGQIDKQDDPDSVAAHNAQSLAEVRQTQEQLNQAKAQLAAAGNDPHSPAYQLALKKAQTAQQNANTATTRATAYMGNYLQGAYNTGLHGDVLPGAPGIGNDQGARTVVGTKNASTAIKNQANVAQFNDVHGALDSLEGSAKALVQSGGKLNDPKIAAALAQPHGTLGQWVQGEVAKGNMTPQQRDYVIANAAAHENIQAMRKAAGGTATDSSVAKLDALIPGASTPDLDYFLRQTGQIRQTAQRLGTGVTTAAGGSNLRNGPNQVVRPANSQAGQPPQALVDGMKEGQYIHGPGGSFQKKDGKLVPVGK